MIICIGVDLGKIRDYAAIVVTEYTPIRVQADGTWWLDIGPPPEEKKWIRTVPDTLYQVRSLRRLQLGTSYPAVGRAINDMCKRLRKKHPEATIYLLMDKTGVGAGPVDIVRELLEPVLKIRLVPCTLTGTDRCEYAPLARTDLSVGKAYMVVRLQAVMQKRLLDVPAGDISRDAIEELKSFEVKTARNGHDTFGAFATGAHDDLITALGLSILGDAHGDRVTYGAPIYT